MPDWSWSSGIGTARRNTCGGPGSFWRPPTASDRRDHAPDGQVQALRLALAGAVHDRGGGRSPARQNPAVACPAAGARGGGARGRADADRSAGGDRPLDRRDDGEGGRHQRQLGPAHLARPRAPAAPGPAVPDASKLTVDFLRGGEVSPRRQSSPDTPEGRTGRPASRPGVEASWKAQAAVRQRRLVWPETVARPFRRPAPPCRGLYRPCDTARL